LAGAYDKSHKHLIFPGGGQIQCNLMLYLTSKHVFEIFLGWQFSGSGPAYRYYAFYLVNWYCSLLAGHTVCGRAAVSLMAVKMRYMTAGLAKIQVVAIQDRCSFNRHQAQSKKSTSEGLSLPLSNRSLLAIMMPFAKNQPIFL